jgi:hypothetical protein
VPILRDFERRLGGLVEGLFSKTFRSGVQPVEIAKRIQREMEDGRSVGVSEVWAPNRFELTMSREDLARYEQAEDAISAELRRVVRETAAERGWGLVGPPEIEFVVDDTLTTGRFRCEASLVEGEPEAPGTVTTAMAPGGDATLSVPGDGGSPKSYAIHGARTTIGRLPDCDVVVDDPGASRHHARIDVSDGEYLLTDLGATNGTLVNEAPIHEHVLQDGDRITIGSTVIEFRRG